MAENRAASSPAVGASREALRVAVAGVITKSLAAVVPEAMTGEVQVIVFALVAMGSAAIGKLARDRGIPIAVWL